MNHRWRRTAFALAAVVALCLLAACSSSSSPKTATVATSGAAASSPAAGATQPAAPSGSAAAKKSGSSGVDVCSLLSAAQASTANAVTYGATKSQSPASGYDTCTYKNTGAADPVNIQDLTVSVLSISGCWSSLQQADGPGTNIAGPGDAAFGYGIGVDIKDGNRCVEVSGLTHAELQNNYAPGIGMAKIILANLH